MKKSKIILFTLRLFFYFSVTGIILIHPGISISFDRIGILQWFLIIPIEAVIAFLPASVFNLRNRCITALLVLFPLSIWAGGLSLDAFAPFIAGLTSFTLTFLLFHHPQWARIAVLEPFFLTWVCLRLLALSRSGEDIAGESAALTQFILVWSAAVFLFHNVVIYFCLFPQSSRRAGKEGGLFFLATFAVLLVTLVILPPDFVRNTVINNLNLEKIPERIRDSDNDLGMPRDSGGRRTGRPTIPGQGDGDGNGQRPGSRGNPGEDGDLGGQPGLRGLSEYDWQNRTERGSGNSGDSRQYMVMIVASEREPVYMGDSFRGQFDSVLGFTAVPDEPLNQLANLRLFVTWFDNERNYDLGRRRQEVFSLSTLPNKYLPYRPVAIDPTILSENSGPLRYIHQVVSNTHLGDPLSLVHTPSRNFSNSERATLAPYFEISLEESDREIFTSYLNETLQWWNKNRESIILSDMYLREIFNNDLQGLSEPVNEYLEKILAILTGFSTYQYNLSFDDDATVASIKEFLVNSKEGDCVEFSNAFALLGRLAGIPTRVVTGYLAAESLQTQAHLRGIAALRRQIPVLQEFDFNDLFMVTNMHSHSWAQFYIPSYGWLDFEATAFAIPPEGEGNFGTWDVVIPIIDETKVFSEIRKFPWTAVLRTAGIMAVLALVCAYILRYGREFVLYLGTRRGGRAGSRSLYLLLLSRLAADGRPIKPASKTALEYSQLFRSQTNFDGAQENAHFKTFADYYSQLRWREFKDEAERDERFSLLKDEYYNILKTTKRQGMLKWFIRIFSLRGLAYL
jgi:transglutaminase-like putative cysteine protease